MFWYFNDWLILNEFLITVLLLHSNFLKNPISLFEYSTFTVINVVFLQQVFNLYFLF